jgi:hypothetical protein
LPAVFTRHPRDPHVSALMYRCLIMVQLGNREKHPRSIFKLIAEHETLFTHAKCFVFIYNLPGPDSPSTCIHYIGVLNTIGYNGLITHLLCTSRPLLPARGNIWQSFENTCMKSRECYIGLHWTEPQACGKVCTKTMCLCLSTLPTTRRREAKQLYHA